MLRELLTINPKPRKAIAHNPRGKAKKSHKAISKRRNPRLLGNLGGLMRPVMPALVGGAGALAVDALLAKLPLPDALKAQIAAGPMRTLARAGAAFLLGWGAGFVVKRETAAQVMAGALTVVAYDELKGLLNRNWPQLLSAYGYDGDLAAYREAVSYNSLPTVRSLDAYREARSVNADVLNGLQPVVR